MDQITVPGVIASIQPITDFVLSVADKGGLDQSTTYRLRLAVEEIVANIIQHGYQDAGRVGSVTVTVQMNPKELVITLEDTGVPYDPREQHTPSSLSLAAEDRDIGGLGVYLALQSVDAFHYERVNERNRNILMVKRPLRMIDRTLMSKTQQVDQILSRFIASFAHLKNSVTKLNKVVIRLAEALQQHGIQMSVDLQPYVTDVEDNLTGTEESSKRVFDQLAQFQKLLDISALISASLELDEVLNTVMDTVINLTSAERAYLVLRDPDTDQLSVRAARNWDQENLTKDDIVFSQGVVDSVLKNAQSIISLDVQMDERFSALQSVASYNLRSILCIPLIVQGQVTGVLYADNSLQKANFTEDSLPLLSIFANQAAIAIENARLFAESSRKAKLEHELQIGQQIQAGFLPKDLPQVSGWDIAAYFHPARQVAGDYYDVFPMTHNKIGFVVGDVCDKGLGAALFMALFRSLLRAFSQQHHSLSWMDEILDYEQVGKRRTSVEERRGLLSSGTVGMKTAISLTNDYIAINHGEANMFATMIFGVIDLHTASLTYVNGGHNPPLLIAADGRVKEKLAVTGPAVGMLPNIEFDSRQTHFEPGDRLICFTDGVVEARNPKGEFFTEGRLLELVQAVPNQTAAYMVKQIRDSVHIHMADADQFDDITLLIVQRLQS
jgi:serine phosphatase RsbU (regulator of sigma subunit)/anti-sigma regulatory factor (Ser/Thr protein kinase)